MQKVHRAYKLIKALVTPHTYRFPHTPPLTPIFHLWAQVRRLCCALGLGPRGPLLCNGRSATKNNRVSATCMAGLLFAKSRPTFCKKYTGLYFLQKVGLLSAKSTPGSTFCKKYAVVSSSYQCRSRGPKITPPPVSLAPTWVG